MPTLQGFSDKIGPAISASWLNPVDVLVSQVLSIGAAPTYSTTPAQVRAALLQDGGEWSIAQGGTGAVTSLQALDNLFAGTSDVELEALNLMPFDQFTQANIVAKLYPPLAQETAAGYPLTLTYPYNTVERFGADPTGVADSSTAFNNAFAIGREIGGTVRSFYGGHYKITAALTIYTDHVGFDGRGSIIDASTMVAGGTTYVFNPANDTVDPTSRGALNAAHPLQNFTIIGPGTGQLVGFINFNDGGADQVIAGITVRNGGSWNFNVHVNYGVGAFFENFEDWFFDTVPGNSSGNFITMGASANSGESNTFTRCRFGISTNPGIQISNGNATTFFTNCRFDGAAQFIEQTAGITFISNLHLESNSDTNYWISLSGGNTAMYISGLALVQGAVTGNKNAFAPFYCDATVVAGVLKIKNWQFEGSGTFSWTVPVCAGTGNTEIDAPGTYQAGAQPYYISAFQNLLADPSFESGSFTADGWVATGGTPPTVANTNPHTGGFSAKFAGVSGQTNSLAKTFTCKPGQMLMGQGWLALTGWTTPTQFATTVAFLNSGGQVISSYSAAPTLTTTTPYTLERFTTFGKAPPGTASVSITFAISGTTTGTPFGYLDDVVLNVV